MLPPICEIYYVSYVLPSQPVDATHASNLSAGVSNPNVFLGRPLKGRFTNNPIWGDGWRWALFKPDNKELNVAKDYNNDCLTCHIPARAKDLIYTEAYPTLKTD